MTTFYIVRHGETEYNAQGITQGHADSPLTDTGKAQALSLGNALKDVSFDAVFSSDLLRAKHTAEIVKLEREMVVETTELLRERRYGIFDGKKSSELRAHLQQVFETLQHATYEERKKINLAPGMESDQEVLDRLLLFLREAAVAYAGKTCLVVSHGAVIRIFLIHTGWALPEELPGGSVGNTAYIKLMSDGVDFVIERVEGVSKKPKS